MDLHFIILVLVVRVDFNGFLRLNHPVAMTVGNIVRGAKEVFSVDVAVATVCNTIGAAVLVVELTAGTDVVSETVCT